MHPLHHRPWHRDTFVLSLSWLLSRKASPISLLHCVSVAACIFQRLGVQESIQLARDAAGLKAEELLSQSSSFLASMLMVYSVDPDVISYLEELKHSGMLSQLAAKGMQYILPAIAR